MIGGIVQVLAVISLLSVAEAIDHCQLNQFHKSKNSSNMQLTKEAVSQEYAVIGAFKSLHCCAKGYRSIEWYVRRFCYGRFDRFVFRLIQSQFNISLKNYQGQ